MSEHLHPTEPLVQLNPGNSQTCLRPFVFIPAKNEQETIAQVVGAIRDIVHRTTDAPVTVLVGDDGSTDLTKSRAIQAGAIVLHYEKSIGLGSNFRKGVEFALNNGADMLVTIDADGQFDEREAEKLIAPILEGRADFVSGSRFLPESKVEGISSIKRWGNQRVSRLISTITGQHFADVSCGYRVYSKEALLRLNLFGGYTYTHEVFLSLAYWGLRIIEVPIHVQYFPGRQSRIAQSLLIYGWQTSKIILKSLIYYRPMWLMTQIALALFVPGFILLALLTVRFVDTGAISPFKSLAIFGTILCLSAAFAIIIGIFLQLFSRIQHNLDTMLYYERRR